LTEDDPVCGDTVFGERRSASKTKRKNWREEDQRSIIHGRSSFICRQRAPLPRRSRMMSANVKQLPISCTAMFGAIAQPTNADLNVNVARP